MAREICKDSILASCYLETFIECPTGQGETSCSSWKETHTFNVFRLEEAWWQHFIDPRAAVPTYRPELQRT